MGYVLQGSFAIISNLNQLLGLKNIRITGLMGMATFTEDKAILESKFSFLKHCFDRSKPKYPEFERHQYGDEW